VAELVEHGDEGLEAFTSARMVHDWQSAGWGDLRFGVEQTFAGYEISAIGGAGSDDPGGSLAFGTAYALLASAAFMPGCDALELRYVAVPTDHGARIRMFVTAKSIERGDAGGYLAAAAAKAAVDALPPTFERQPMSTPSFIEDPVGVDCPVFELRRNEQITFPQWDFVPADFYYQVSDRPGDGSGWGGFWRVLSSAASPVAVSVVVKPTQLDPIERDVLGSVMTDLALFGEPRHDHNVIGQDVFYPACENARLAGESWQARLDALQRPLLGRVAVRGQPGEAMSVATALAAAIARSDHGQSASAPMAIDSPVEPNDVFVAGDAFDSLEIVPWGGIELWKEDVAPHSLRRMPYLYGLAEAAGITVLPVADEQGVPGFPRARRIAPRRRETGSTAGGPSIEVGRVLHLGADGGAARLPLSAVNRHVLVVGTPGSGKTTSVLTLISSLWREHGVPFLVLEPTKHEYRGLLDLRGLEDLRVVCLGRDDLAPIRLNPLAPPPGVRCEVHASSVVAAIRAAVPLPAPLPQMLEDAVERAYRRAGWSDDTTSADGIAPPSLRTVMSAFEDVYERSGYVGDARNVASAMRTRLRSLVRGGRGRLLDTVESTDFTELMSVPVVVELDEIGDPEDKAIVAAFVLDRIRAVAKARGSGRELRHVTVVEEAHRLLGRAAPASGVDGGDPRSAGVEAFSNAIAELRSVGEGFVLSSQSPARLAPAAVDNCSSRILHRLESAADREVMLADLDSSDHDRDAAARLAPGEALVRWPPMEESEVMRVVAPADVDSSEDVSDEVVRERMAAPTREVRRLLPYPLCTRDVCAGGCDPDVRRDGDGVADDVADVAARLWEESGETAQALDPIVALLRREAGDDPQLMFCAAAHLAARGAALDVRRRVDIRPRLVAAIRGDG
jgi:DNA helicase HerA-like ATPase